MTACFITAIIFVLCLLLQFAHRLRCRFIKQRQVAARKERAHELFAVNPHRQRAPSKRSRFFRTMFLMKQNDSKFVEDTKFIYGTVFELDNSHEHTDTTTVVDINAQAWEEAALLKSRRKTWIREVAKITNAALSILLRRSNKLIHFIIKTVTKYIHNVGGKNRHA